VATDVWEEVHESLNSEKLAVVIHPGFWHKGWKKYVLSVVFILEVIFPFFDVRKFIRGSWEMRPTSTAYVPRRLRRHYFAGAIWFGPRNLVLNFVNCCSINTAIDSSSGIIAVHHDESHLNHWASINRRSIKQKDPGFCFTLEYEQIACLTPKVIAVEKMVRTR
jgi:hypothetical protein